MCDQKCDFDFSLLMTDYLFIELRIQLHDQTTLTHNHFCSNTETRKVQRLEKQNKS